MQYLLWDGRDWDKKDKQAKWTETLDRMMFYRGPKIWDGLEEWMVFGSWGEAFQGENLEWGKTERLEYMQSIKMTQASSSVYILIYEWSRVRWCLETHRKEREAKRKGEGGREGGGKVSAHSFSVAGLFLKKKKKDYVSKRSTSWLCVFYYSFFHSY